eukprot:1137252-Pelagomonas_calceolata.AAC.2
MEPVRKLVFISKSTDARKVTGRAKNVVSSSLLNFESMDTKAESGHAAHGVFGQIQLQTSG